MKMTPLILTLPALALVACQQQSADESAAASNATMSGGDAMMTAGNDASAMMPNASVAAPADAAGYVAQAGAADLFEIESSKIALEKSQNKAVRDFAQMMIDQHQKSTANIKAAAEKAGVTVQPPALMANQQQMLEEIKAADAGSFDSVYMRNQRMAHDAALALHQGYARNGDTPALKQTAGAVAKVVQEHIDHLASLPTA
ncbi:DUF4142 domain-containing protein [Sphingobium lactosutens]|uniref:DUF4142 domain-containing protein n=1 Tax=Sphingobium lactosutens DS20 TaxID=1331060 RepID=T0IUS1_9SPHN|nr:DUF4142 domain-containing protein [Sphingobium lactosutens]EQB13409.1 hypothetical protein RLDS_16885 [Sphingobium lactosutens DS20]